MRSRITAIILAAAVGATLAGCTPTGGSDGNGGPAEQKITLSPSASALTSTGAIRSSLLVPTPSTAYGTPLNDAARHSNGSATYTFKYPQEGVTLSALVQGNADVKLKFAVTVNKQTILAKTLSERPQEYDFFLTGINHQYVGKTVTVAFTVSGTASKKEFGGVVAFDGANGH